jgi:hypothetical protein
MRYGKITHVSIIIINHQEGGVSAPHLSLLNRVCLLEGNMVREGNMTKRSLRTGVITCDDKWHVSHLGKVHNVWL